MSHKKDWVFSQCGNCQDNTCNIDKNCFVFLLPISICSLAALISTHAYRWMFNFRQLKRDRYFHFRFDLKHVLTCKHILLYFFLICSMTTFFTFRFGKWIGLPFDLFQHRFSELPVTFSKQENQNCIPSFFLMKIDDDYSDPFQLQ